MTLEREIGSIETANINKETLDAMKNAGIAIKQIHAGLTVDTVDDVMYVLSIHFPPPCLHIANSHLGKDSANNMPSAKKSAQPSPLASAPKASTKTSSTTNSQNSNKKPSMRRCSTRAASP